MWNESNPTSLYLGTTWELISSGKYIQTGNTALQSGGNNSIRIEKTNLPDIKLNTTSATATIQPHKHLIRGAQLGNNGYGNGIDDVRGDGSNQNYNSRNQNMDVCLEAGGGITGSFSLLTEAMGSGTPLNIQPSYITLKFWKRTS